MKFYGWKGKFIDAYFNDLHKGEWVQVNIFVYIYLWMQNYIRKIDK